MSFRAKIRRPLVALAVAVVTWGVVAPAAAQNPGGELEIVKVDTSRHPEVTLTVAAPRALAGKTVPTEGFEVREDGTVKKISAEKLPGDALEVILVIDVSGSMEGDAMAAAKSAARGFVEQMPPGTRVGIVSFSDTAVVASPFETDPAVLSGVIDGLDAGGETALYDALAATVEVSRQGSAGARRAIVVLSDGGDTVSQTPIEGVLASLGTIEADFFAVALATSEADTGVLEALAGSAGGRVVTASDPAQLAEAYDSIASRLVSQYEILFQSRAEGPTEFAVSVNFEGVSSTAAHKANLPALPEGLAGGPVAAPKAEVAGGASVLESGWTFWAGAFLLATAFAGAGWLLFSNREFRRRLAREFEHRSGKISTAAMSDLSQKASAFADRLLEQRGRAGGVNRALERAGLNMRPGEFLVLAVVSSLGAWAVGAFLGGFLLGVIFGGITAWGFKVSLGVLAQRRQAAFADQLGATLQLLAGSLRSGYGVTQAIDVVAREADSPTSDEFRRLVVESRLGRDMIEGLHGVADRVGNDDFMWVVQAMEVHRDVGGDLAEVFDKVGETIRDRNRVRRQIKALSAEGRLSAVILFILPFAMALVINTTNPNYFAELTGSSAGNLMLLFGAGLMAVGAVWLRKIIKLEF